MSFDQTAKVARTRVKICGLTRVSDALAAVHYGADAIGLVFYGPSPRNVDIATAQSICAALPPFVTTVGLFVDAPVHTVQQVLAAVPLGLLQFHGSESASYCQQFARPYIKALRVAAHTDLTTLAAKHAQASGLLLDTYVKGVPGGTGAVFNWQVIPNGLCPRITLAGGLTAANVGQAIAAVGPYAVDVSGGVERQPGQKCPEKIAGFMAAVAQANAALNRERA